MSIKIFTKFCLAVLGLSLVAACQSSTTGKRFVIKDPAKADIVWWLKDYDFPAVFLKGRERRERSATIQNIIHVQDGYLASMQQAHTIGNRYWYDSGDGYDNELGWHIGRENAEGAVLNDTYVLKSPIGNVGVALFTMRHGRGCLVFRQYGASVADGYKSKVSGVFCKKEGTLSKVEAQKIVAGIGVDDKMPDLSLKPKKTRYTTLFPKGRPHSKDTLYLNWETVAANAQLNLITSDLTRSAGDFEFSFPTPSAKVTCFGRWHRLSGSGSRQDKDFKAEWSVYCDNGAEAYGTYTFDEAGNMNFIGSDRSGNDITATKYRRNTDQT